MKKKDRRPEEDPEVAEKAAEDDVPADGEADEQPPAEETVEHWKDLYLRAQADLQNVRRRMLQETEDQVQRRMEALLHDLIRVSDYLEAALGNVPESVREAEHADAFLAGMEAIRHALDAVMKGHGMQFLAPGEDHEFDPEEHEAVETEVIEDLESPRLELLGRGYRIGRRILRPARVRLLTPPGAEAETGGDPAAGDDDGR